MSDAGALGLGWVGGRSRLGWCWEVVVVAAATPGRFASGSDPCRARFRLGGAAAHFAFAARRSPRSRSSTARGEIVIL